MPNTFDDLLSAGRIDEKTVFVRGVELTVKPLTYAQAIEIARLQKNAEKEIDGSHIELTKKAIKYAISKPEMDDQQISKLMEMNSAFVSELLKTILSGISNEDKSAKDDEKN